MDTIKINLGCGEKLHEDCINIDKLNLPGVDIISNLEEAKLPFKNSSVDEIRCEHILEHITNFMPLMEEIWRISKNKTIIKVSAPYYRYEGAYRDPTHVRFFTEHSFDYFQDNLTYSFYSKVRLKVKKLILRNRFFSGIKDPHKKMIIYIPFKKFLNLFFWNIYSEIYYELEVIKK